jgi:hypothetical protein
MLCSKKIFDENLKSEPYSNKFRSNDPGSLCAKGFFKLVLF